MTKDTKLSELVINKLTTEQYNSITTKDPNQLYIVTDAPGFDESRTNCITGISQDINLELNDGTLTLKAGSKVYVPNGAGEFDVKIIESDISSSTTGAATLFVITYNSGASLFSGFMTGGTVSERPSSPIRYAIYYNTGTNKVEFYDGSSWYTDCSFPLAIVTRSDNGYTSIDQVFNGFGYIGSTIFALPGVKGLIPNGRNTNGSLKNTEVTVDKVFTRTSTGTNTYKLCLTISGIFESSVSVYDEVNNVVYNRNNNQLLNCCEYGIMSRENAVITSFQLKHPFHAVDRNDSSWVSAQAMPSGKYIDLTLGASGSTYTAPANGWFTISKTAGTAGAQINFSASGNSLGVLFYSGASITSYCKGFIPAKKGQTITIQYSATGETNIFRFIYAEGEN